MKYPYIGIRPIIAEVYGDLKTLSAVANYTEEDCYIWAIDAIRQIGGGNYDTEMCYIHVSKHNGHLPKDMYLLNELWLCGEQVPTVEMPVTPGPKMTTIYYTRTAILRPADSVTWKYCNSDCINSAVNKAAHSYTIKLPPGIIKTSIPDCILSLEYLKMKTDEQGVIMMQDEVNGILAVKNYVTMMLLREGFLMGQVQANSFMLIKSEWEDYLTLARQKQVLPSNADTAFLAIQQDQRYRRFRIY